MDVQQLARKGAEVRLAEILVEQQALAAFLGQDLAGTPQDAVEVDAPAVVNAKRGMSAKQRKLVSQRMKAYWKQRRAENA